MTCSAVVKRFSCEAAFISAVLCVRGHQSVSCVLRSRKEQLIQEVKYSAPLAANTSRNIKLDEENQSNTEILHISCSS